MGLHDCLVSFYISGLDRVLEGVKIARYVILEVL